MYNAKVWSVLIHIAFSTGRRTHSETSWLIFRIYECDTSGCLHIIKKQLTKRPINWKSRIKETIQSVEYVLIVIVSPLPLHSIAALYPCTVVDLQFKTTSPPWILKLGGLERSGWRLISLIGKTNEKSIAWQKKHIF